MLAGIEEIARRRCAHAARSSRRRVGSRRQIRRRVADCRRRTRPASARPAATSGVKHRLDETDIEDDQSRTRDEMNENDARPKVDAEVGIFVLADEPTELDATGGNVARSIGRRPPRQSRNVVAHMRVDGAVEQQ